MVGDLITIHTLRRIGTRLTIIQARPTLRLVGLIIPDITRTPVIRQRPMILRLTLTTSRPIHTLLTLDQTRRTLHQTSPSHIIIPIHTRTLRRQLAILTGITTHTLRRTHTGHTRVITGRTHRHPRIIVPRQTQAVPVEHVPEVVGAVAGGAARVGGAGLAFCCAAHALLLQAVVVGLGGADAQFGGGAESAVHCKVAVEALAAVCAGFAAVVAG